MSMKSKLFLVILAMIVITISTTAPKDSVTVAASAPSMSMDEKCRRPMKEKVDTATELPDIGKISFNV